MWRENLGIDVQLYNMEYKVLLDRQEHGDFEIGRGGWWADYADPSTFLELLRPGSAQNNGRWESKAYGEALDLGLRATNEAERNRHFADAERLALEAMPVLPLYVYSYSDLVKPYVKGISPNNRHIHPLRAVWIDDAREPTR
jgi:oligopeptide transport system substrate-binding protein